VAGESVSMVIVLTDLSFHAGAGTDLRVESVVERSIVAAESVSLVILSIDTVAGIELSMERPIVGAKSCLLAYCTHLPLIPQQSQALT
jgi:hypothetical protein